MTSQKGKLDILRLILCCLLLSFAIKRALVAVRRRRQRRAAKEDSEPTAPGVEPEESIRLRRGCTGACAIAYINVGPGPGPPLTRDPRAQGSFKPLPPEGTGHGTPMEPPSDPGLGAPVASIPAPPGLNRFVRAFI